MAEWTAAEWNERHPPGSVVWYPTTDGPRLGMQWGIAADEFDDYYQFDNGPGVVLGRISSGLSEKIAPPFPLADLEPVATDEQRRSEGWLDPERAATLTAELDKHRKRRAGEWLDETCSDREPLSTRPCILPFGHDNHFDGRGTLWRYDTAAVRAVVDAARALVGAVVSPATHPSSAVSALVDAVDVYDRLTGRDEGVSAVTLSPGGRYRLVGPDGVWVVTGLSTAGDTAEVHLRREPNEGDTDHG